MDDDIQLTQEISSLRPSAFIIHMTNEIDKCWFLQLYFGVVILRKSGDSNNLDLNHPILKKFSRLLLIIKGKINIIIK